MRPTVLLFFVFLLAGCAGTSRVDPLPFEGADDFSSCQQLVSFGFVTDQAECEAGAPVYVHLNETQVNSDAYRYRRNTLQGEIMRWADNRCDAALQVDENQSGRQTTVQVTRVVAYVLSAFATAGATNNEQDITTQLTSTASMFTNLGTLFSPSEDDEAPDPRPGIALAKAEVRQEIEQKRDLDVAAYPVSVAVADAERYDEACSREAGEDILSRAAAIGMQQLLN